jgi:ABC-type multidrug transport system ATPase subunit
MLEVRLQDVSRHFYYRWVFKNLSYVFQSPNWYSITGSNGSGKSTLPKVISGFLSPSKGSLAYAYNGAPIPVDGLYPYLSLAAPYMDLISEFSPEEQLSFHNTFKPLKNGYTINSILKATALSPHRKKAIRFFSSGMVQRLRLAQALYFDTSLLLLDEPTSHLDAQGVAWYQSVLKANCQDQCVVIASNNPDDYQECHYQLAMEDYNPLSD